MKHLLIIFTIILTTSIANAESMRWGTKLIQRGATKTEVQNLCGRPVAIAYNGVIHSDDVYTDKYVWAETWHYKTGINNNYYLLFYDDKLHKITQKMGR